VDKLSALLFLRKKSLIFVESAGDVGCFAFAIINLRGANLMKKCLSPNALLELSEMQKSSLRDLWQPNKYDLAAEIVWKDVENNICDAVVVMVLDARASVTHTQYCEVVLKVFYLGSPPQYECLDSKADDEESDSDEEVYDDPTESDSEETSEGHYLNKENCLPLLNIGQMIEILGRQNAEMNINLNPEEAICYMDGREFSGEELCDALWEAVKTLL
jgi:hypothetical protein